MKFCVKCGEQLKEKSNFCTACGARVEPGTPIEANSEVENEIKEQSSTDVKVQNEDMGKRTTKNDPVVVGPTTQTAQMIKKPMKRVTKIILISVISIVVLLFGAHKWLKSYFDPMKDLVAIEEAILSQDVKQFYKLIDIVGEAIIDEEGYLSYIKDVEWENGLKSQYTYMLEMEEENPSPLEKRIESMTGDLLFRVKPQSSLFWLYKKNKITAVPIELYVSTNYDDVSITLLGENITIENKEEGEKIDEIYPGKYFVEAEANGKYGDFTYSEEFELYQHDVEYLDIYFSGNYYYVYTNYGYEEAILYIDGEATDIQITDYYDLGPVPEDVDLVLHAVWKDENDVAIRSNPVSLSEKVNNTDINFTFDSYRSNPVSLSEKVNNTDINFTFDSYRSISADVKEEYIDVSEFVLDFRGAYEFAVNYADYYEIERYLQPSSEAEKELQEFIEEMESPSHYYDFLKNYVMDVEKEDDKVFKVVTNERFDFWDEDFTEHYYERDKVYTVILNDEGDYFISEIEITNTDKTKRE